MTENDSVKSTPSLSQAKAKARAEAAVDLFLGPGPLEYYFKNYPAELQDRIKDALDSGLIDKGIEERICAAEDPKQAEMLLEAGIAGEKEAERIEAGLTAAEDELRAGEDALRGQNLSEEELAKGLQEVQERYQARYQEVINPQLEEE